MADEAVASEPTEESTEQVVDKTHSDDANKKVKAETARMAKALADLQKKNAELEDFRKSAEREKLSETERIKAEKEDLVEKLRKHQEDLAAARAELERERLISKLTAEGLEDPEEFGPTILSKYDPDEGTWDEFVAGIKAGKKFGKLFRQDTPAERVAVPASPKSGGTRVNKIEGVSDRDRERAEKLYPKDKKMQELFLKNLAAADQTIRSRATDPDR